MTYTIRHSYWPWLIEPDSHSKRFRLKFKLQTVWTDCSSFDTPEAAADAVAQEKTGQKDWDDIKKDALFPGLAAWLIDPAASVLATALPVVSGRLRAAIPPSRLEPGQNPWLASPGRFRRTAISRQVLLKYQLGWSPNSERTRIAASSGIHP